MSLEDKLDELIKEQREFNKECDRRLDCIEKVLLVQENNLNIHMKRSDHLEKLLQNIEERDLQPLRKHVAQVEGALKVLGGTSVVLSIIGALSKFLGLI